MKRKVAKKFSVRSFIEMNLAYKLVIVMEGYFWQEKKPTINAFEPKADLQGVFNLANLSIQTWLPLKRYVMRT